MSDENWIRELAKAHRERQAEEEGQLGKPWDRLSSSELSAEEEAELLALAESSEEGREAYEAFRPLGPEFHASAVKAIREQKIQEQAEKPTLMKVLAKLFFFRRVQFAGWGTAAAAVAAVWFLHVHNPLPPLPPYTMDPPQGDQDSRGEIGLSTGLPVFHPGSLLPLNLAPQQSVKGPVEAHAFLVDGGDLVPWKPEPPVEVAESGMVRLRGTLGEEIQLPPGEQTIWIVVSRKGKSPSLSELQASLRTRRTRYGNWQAVCDAITASPLRQDQWQVACANLRVEDQPPT